MATGALIVIDGADGSGKATQARLLAERLKEEGYMVETLDFPQYTKNFFGKFIRECLDGKHGDFIAVHPKIASVLYAADRFESRDQIEKWLEEGAVVILDRYVSANMIHQGSKIADEQERAEFLAWLDEMEHQVFGNLRPDLIVHLDVPHEVRRALVAQDASRTSTDLAERDSAHQKAAEECARGIVAASGNWCGVSCVTEGALRTREDIHGDVAQIALTMLKKKGVSPRMV